jgi:hypothetical protein
MLPYFSHQFTVAFDVDWLAIKEDAAGLWIAASRQQPIANANGGYLDRHNSGGRGWGPRRSG